MPFTPGQRALQKILLIRAIYSTSYSCLPSDQALMFVKDYCTEQFVQLSGCTLCNNAPVETGGGEEEGESLDINEERRKESGHAKHSNANSIFQ